MTTLTLPVTDDTTPALISTSLHPIVPGFHPDPTICRVGDDYYLANSSFEYSPGVPIRHSRDLVHWELIGNALERADQFPAGHSGASKGVYAPTLRHHNGRFWLITTDVSGSGGQLLVSAEQASGPWTAARVIPGLQGIDPDLAWTDDGRCYVTYCSTAVGLTGIAQAQIDLDSTAVLTDPRLIWNGTGLAFPEGPHLYRHDGWWYLVIAEGGTERGHTVSVARSRDIEGPFTAAPTSPLLSHRSTEHPVQNIGHADFVRTVDGSWAVVYLGVRPRGITPMFHVNGRETFLAGVDWINGWPTIDEDRYSRALRLTRYVDTFDAPRLHQRWISPGAALADMATATPGTGLTLRPARAASGAISALTARVEDPWWSFEISMDTTAGSASLLVRLDDRHWYELRAQDGYACAVARIGEIEAVVGETVTIDASRTRLLAETVESESGGPDDVLFSAIINGSNQPIARIDGRYLSTEVAGGFTGRVVGIRPIDGVVAVHRVEYIGSATVPESVDLG
ncbi:family 43 glycosylhydrolase [Microbacteriaceae bacterium VKM Ac-2855]|nr:family 43 glycosylhydrolase [Microbacteriaceae bacterium VKM Ac-2855]